MKIFSCFLLNNIYDTAHWTNIAQESNVQFGYKGVDGKTEYEDSTFMHYSIKDCSQIAQYARNGSFSGTGVVLMEVGVSEGYAIAIDMQMVADKFAEFLGQ